MKFCKLKPTLSTCRNCIDIQQEYDFIRSCSGCESSKKEYELLQIGVTFLGQSYAIVSSDGELHKVAMNRVYDVREV